VFRGTRGLAGEIGHLCLDAQGPFCTCGSRGCFEQYASASAIERSYREKITKRCEVDSQSITAETVFQRAKTGDPSAGEVVRETAWHIARVFGNLVNIFNPQACIIGGGISAAGEQLLRFVRAYIADFAWPLPLTGVIIHTAALQNEAGVLGAAAQCLERIGSPTRHP
jgi:glucokinase